MRTKLIPIDTFETRAIAETKAAYDMAVRMAAMRRGIYVGQVTLTPGMDAFVVSDDAPPPPPVQKPEEEGTQ